MQIERKEGFLRYSVDDMNSREVILDNIFIKKEYRDKGIASILMTEFLKKVRKMEEIDSIGLYADPQEEDGISDDNLINFYKKYGFKSDGDCDKLMTLFF